MIDFTALARFGSGSGVSGFGSVSGVSGLGSGSVGSSSTGSGSGGAGGGRQDAVDPVRPHPELEAASPEARGPGPQSPGLAPDPRSGTLFPRCLGCTLRKIDIYFLRALVATWRRCGPAP